jgi:hypothetical protein
MDGNLTTSFLHMRSVLQRQEVNRMQSILRKLVLAPAVLAAAALAITSATAETTIKVPFAFTVAGQAFPAGRYLVQRDDTGSFVTLASKDSARSTSWVLGPGAPGPTENKVALKFNDTHALQTIQYGSMITSRLDKKTAESERSDRLSGGR